MKWTLSSCPTATLFTDWLQPCHFLVVSHLQTSKCRPWDQEQEQEVPWSAFTSSSLRRFAASAGCQPPSSHSHILCTFFFLIFHSIISHHRVERSRNKEISTCFSNKLSFLCYFSPPPTHPGEFSQFSTCLPASTESMPVNKRRLIKRRLRDAVAPLNLPLYK